MEHYDFDATLFIHIEADAPSKEAALANAIQTGNYEVTGSSLTGDTPPRYLSTAEYAKKLGLKSNIYISKLCAQGVIPGVIRLGNNYAIPENAPYRDRRVTSGNYVGAGYYDKYRKKKYEEEKARKAAEPKPIEPQREPTENPVARARRECGVSRAQLAAAIEMPERIVARWESGERKPRKATLQRIADALSIDINRLMD